MILVLVFVVVNVAKKMIILIKKILNFFVIVIRQKENKIGLINLLQEKFKKKYFHIC